MNLVDDELVACFQRILTTPGILWTGIILWVARTPTGIAAVHQRDSNSIGSAKVDALIPFAESAPVVFVGSRTETATANPILDTSSIALGTMNRFPGIMDRSVV